MTHIDETPEEQAEQMILQFILKQETVFINSLTLMGMNVHDTAMLKGWWEGDRAERNDGELIALIHSELSEALEACRHDNPPSEKIPEFSHAEEEMADVIIRILDMARVRKWNIGGAIVAKAKHNLTRTKRHGGKKF